MKQYKDIVEEERDNRRYLRMMSKVPNKAKESFQRKAYQVK